MRVPRITPVALVAVLAVTASAERRRACSNASTVDTFVRSGNTARVCLDDGARECWQIDARGRLAPLAARAWPAVAKSRPAGDLHPRPAQDDGVELRLPDGFTAKVTYDDASGTETIELCDRGACKRLRPKQRRNLDDVRAIAVLPDRRTVLVGQGVSVVSAEKLYHFDLRRPTSPQLLLRCAELLDVVDGNLLIQQTDCANAGGPRYLYTPTGRRLATLGPSFSTIDPIYATGDHRWLVVGYHTFAVWDLAKGKRLSSVPDCPPP